MSYSIETGPPQIIQFYYKTEDLFNSVSLRSLYRALNIKSEAGEALIDDFAITLDEEDAFDLLIRDAAHEVFQYVLKMCRGVTDALVLDDAIEILGVPDTGPYYAVHVLDNEAYNANNLELVENTVKMLLQVHVLKNWYEMKGHTDEQTKLMAKYNSLKIKLINKDLFQLRKPLLT